MTESNGASYDTHLRRGPKPPTSKTHTKTVIQAGDNSQTLHLREPKEIVCKMWITLIATATFCFSVRYKWHLGVSQLLCAALLLGD